MGVNQ